jgi:mannose-6-phosphate isomerase-like protein (cupin superfamily)
VELVREQDKAFRGGTSGVKYLMRGPRLDWGVLVLAPGEQLGQHKHLEVEEVFFFIEGTGGQILVNGTEYPVGPGTAVRVEPGEVHNIVNDTRSPLKTVFIKSPFNPTDKVDV